MYVVKGSEPEAEKTVRLARKRVTGRLLVELYEAGVYTETAPLTSAMLDLSAGLQVRTAILLLIVGSGTSLSFLLHAKMLIFFFLCY